MESQKLKKFCLSFGALLGMTAVMAGAMGAHALKDILSVDQLNSFQTAVRYQMFHALLLLVLGWNSPLEKGLIRAAVLLLAAGVVLFSGSIYLLVLTEAPRWLGPVTPLGGSLMILGWASLLVWALGNKK